MYSGSNTLISLTNFSKKVKKFLNFKIVLKLLIKKNKIYKIRPQKQDLNREIRHTKKKDFYNEDISKILNKRINKSLLKKIGLQSLFLTKNVHSKMY